MYNRKMRLQNQDSLQTGVRTTWDLGESPQQLILWSNKAAGRKAWAGCTLLLSPPQRLTSSLSKGCFSDSCLLPLSLHGQKGPQWWGKVGMSAEPVI